MCQWGVDERVHKYSLTYGQSVICFYMMGLGANFTMREIASSANRHANCHYDIYSVRKNVSMFLKKGGILRRMEVKNIRGLIHLSALCISFSANKLNCELKKVINSTFQWKMSFNPDPSKQAQVIFSRKLKKVPHPSFFDNAYVSVVNLKST